MHINILQKLCKYYETVYIVLYLTTISSIGMQSLIVLEVPIIQYLACTFKYPFCAFLKSWCDHQGSGVHRSVILF